MTPTYNHLEMEAALCIWEHLDACSGRETDFPDIAAFRRAYGTAEFRHSAIALVSYCLEVYNCMPTKLIDGLAYDWEVIPAILDSVDWRAMPNLPSVEHGVAHARTALTKLQRQYAPKPKDRVPLCAGEPAMPPDKLSSRALPFSLFSKRFKPIANKGDILREKLPRDPIEAHWWAAVPIHGTRWHILPGTDHRYGAFFIKCRVPRAGRDDQHPRYAY